MGKYHRGDVGFAFALILLPRFSSFSWNDFVVLFKIESSNTFEFTGVNTQQTHADLEAKRQDSVNKKTPDQVGVSKFRIDSYVIFFPWVVDI